MPIGNRVYLKRKLPATEIIEGFGFLPAANIADAINRSCAMAPRIRLMSSPKRQITAGPALTVKVREGDNLLLHKALDIAQEGDIIVVANGGTDNRALMGEIMFTLASYRKLGGIILDGPLRDVDAVRKMDYPIYATGSTPGGPYKEGPGEVNVPISCGEISVSPGDIIVMDQDGVIVIPRKDAPGLLETARQFSQQDAGKVTAAANGTAKRDWVDRLLQEKQVEIIDGYYEN